MQRALEGKRIIAHNDERAARYAAELCAALHAEAHEQSLRVCVPCCVVINAGHQERISVDEAAPRNRRRLRICNCYEQDQRKTDCDHPQPRHEPISLPFSVQHFTLLKMPGFEAAQPLNDQSVIIERAFFLHDCDGLAHYVVAVADRHRGRAFCLLACGQHIRKAWARQQLDLDGVPGMREIVLAAVLAAKVCAPALAAEQLGHASFPALPGLIHYSPTPKSLRVSEMSRFLCACTTPASTRLMPGVEVMTSNAP